MEAKAGAVIDRVEMLLLKVVGEPWESLYVQRGLMVLGATKCVHDHQSVPFQGCAAGLEIGE